MRLARVVGAYNETPHEAMGISPTEAMNEENWARLKQMEFETQVRTNEQRRSKETWPVLTVGESVWIRDELARKGQPKFAQRAVVREVCPFDTYQVKTEKGK